jgi:hypothetical protein
LPIVYAPSGLIVPNNLGDLGLGKLTAASHGRLFGELLDDVSTDYAINNR